MAGQVLQSSRVQALPPPGRVGARTRSCLGAQPGCAGQAACRRVLWQTGSADCDDFRGENYGYFSLFELKSPFCTVLEARTRWTRPLKMFGCVSMEKGTCFLYFKNLNDFVNLSPN